MPEEEQEPLEDVLKRFEIEDSQGGRFLQDAYPILEENGNHFTTKHPPVPLPGDLILKPGHYHLAEDTGLAFEGNVTILPGTIFTFENNAHLLINGNIHARGTKEQPITFSPVGKGCPKALFVIEGSKGSKLEHCVIQGFEKAGLTSFDSTVVLEYCEVKDNSGAGGILVRGGSMKLLETTVRGNSSESAGGGIVSYAGIIYLVNSEIATNSSETGAGIFLQEGGSVTLDNTKLIGNTAALGGGICMAAGYLKLINGSALINNHAQRHGGAIMMLGGNVECDNSEFTGNVAIYDGGAICVYEKGTLSLINTVLKKNQAKTGGAIHAAGRGVLCDLDTACRVGENSKPQLYPCGGAKLLYDPSILQDANAYTLAQRARLLFGLKP